LWSQEDCDYRVNRLGNLVFLSRAKNSEASNYDFQEKKERYFRTRSGVSLYASTAQVLKHDQWTVDEVRKRHEELLEIFRKGWELSVD
jgi:hypothetical protein